MYARTAGRTPEVVLPGSSCGRPAPEGALQTKSSEQRHGDEHRSTITGDSAKTHSLWGKSVDDPPDQIARPDQRDQPQRNQCKNRASVAHKTDTEEKQNPWK